MVNVSPVILMPGNSDFNDGLKSYLTNHHPDSFYFPQTDAKFFPSQEAFAKPLENVRFAKVQLVSHGGISYPQEVLEHIDAAHNLQNPDAIIKADAIEKIFTLTGIEATGRTNPEKLIQLICRAHSVSPNDSFIQSLVMIDALQRAGMSDLIYVSPFLPYGRQDRKASARDPITARLVADLIDKSASHKLRGIITSDMHVPQEQGFYSVPVDDLPTTLAFAADIKATMHRAGLTSDDIIIFSTDLGGSKRAQAIAKELNCLIGTFDKRRVDIFQQEAVTEILVPFSTIDLNDPKAQDPFKGKVCFFVDDMVDSGSSLITAAQVLRENFSPRYVGFYGTHGVLTPKAVEKLQDPAIDSFVFTNTIQIPPYMKLLVDSDRISNLDVTPWYGEVMYRSSLPYNPNNGAEEHNSVASINDLHHVTEILNRGRSTLGRVHRNNLDKLAPGG